MSSMIRGRCTAINDRSVCVVSEKGSLSLPVRNPSSCSLGDIVCIENETVTVLTPNRLEDGAAPLMTQILDPRRLRALDVRMKVEASIKTFFANARFREVKTPLLVPCPGMEPHIRPFEISGTHIPTKTYLPTSPEFAMKRLLVGGLERIFQMNTAFRDEPPSVTHLPEFTMLEWYRAYADVDQIMRDTESLLAHVAKALSGAEFISFQGQRISVAPPWPRFRVRDLFLDWLGIDLLAHADRAQLARAASHLGLNCSEDENWDDIYFKIWLNHIEPKLPKDRAIFVTDYPPSQAALAVLREHADGTKWARRFEAYAGGIELCNAFEELTDPIEQRRRFEKDMTLRTEIYGNTFPPTPIDEGFIAALTEGMPPAGGNALGVDRLVMLFADEPDIRYTVWLP